MRWSIFASDKFYVNSTEPHFSEDSLSIGLKCLFIQGCARKRNYSSCKIHAYRSILRTSFEYVVTRDPNLIITTKHQANPFTCGLTFARNPIPKGHEPNVLCSRVFYPVGYSRDCSKSTLFEWIVPPRFTSWASS